MRLFFVSFLSVGMLSFGFLLPISSAFADDKAMGILFAADGGSINNSVNGPTAVDGGPAAFALSDNTTAPVQCDASAYVRAVDTSSGSVTASNGVKVSAGQLYDVYLQAGQKWVAARCVSGDCSCNVFQLRAPR
jgi:hypothetical protein